MAISANPTTRTYNRYVRNVVTTFERATPKQLQTGMAWYRVAHDIAASMSQDVRVGAGVIAVMSARTEWQDNLNRATRAITTGTATGHTKAVLARAQRIISGEDPETILPMQFKTGHFYRCIVDPDNVDSVVIDRHAYDVAVGKRFGDKEDRGLSSRSRYDLLARVYRDAAWHHGVLPLEVQAVTWTVQVDEFQYKRV